MPPVMKSGVTPKSIVLLFPVVLVAYLLVFYGLEHLRHRKGPWDAEFRVNAKGVPTVTVAQPDAGLKNVSLVYHGETTTNEPGRISFDRVKQPSPVGRVIYEDLTFFPGVVTLDLFGHEVELLPRTLIANKKGIPWKSGAVIDFWPTNKPAEPPHPPQERKR
jgi:hypothetical protein